MSTVEVVYTSRKKCAAMVVVSILWVGMCLIPSLLGSLALGVPLAVFGLGFIAPFLMFCVSHVVARSPAVALSEEGVTDSAWAMSNGLLKWDEIALVTTVGFGPWKMLVFHVANPNKILGRLSLTRRLYARANCLLFPSSFILPGNTIEGSVDELAERINAFRKTVVAPKQGW